MRRLALLLCLVACGGGGGGYGGTPTAPQTPNTPTPAAVASVTVSGGSSGSLAVGATQQLTATIKDASGNTLTGRIVTWSTSSAAIVTVSNTGLATAVAAGTATITATSESQQGTASVSVAASSIVTLLGTILTPADFSVASGPVADCSAVQLSDGRVRLYLFAQGQGVRSAISTTSAGTAFTVESGLRSLTPAWGQPRVIKLSDGRVRLFYFTADGVHSAVSTDGLTFTDESGTRILNSDVGYEIGGISIVPTSAGYRGYFSDLGAAGGAPGGHRIRSATSTDLLSWTVEPGIVLGVGATTTLNLSSVHPFASAGANGSVTLYYQGDRPNTSGPGFTGLLRATSTDGRTFLTEERIGIDSGGDPDVIKLANGTTMIYYGGSDPNVSAPVLKAAKLNQ